MSDCVDLVGGILENYANRGFFRGFSRGPVRGGKAFFKILWHRDRVFELILDTNKRSLRFPVVLPQVPADSSMYRELRDFVASRQSADVPEHRRIDPAKARIAAANRAGNISLTLKLADTDYEYATRKFINLVHEIFMVFLLDGPYFEYMVEVFDLDPDHP